MEMRPLLKMASTSVSAIHVVNVRLAKKFCVFLYRIVNSELIRQSSFFFYLLISNSTVAAIIFKRSERFHNTRIKLIIINVSLKITLVY
jgi:hypothetical protein